MLLPPSSRKGKKNSPRNIIRKPLTKSQYYSQQGRNQKKLNSDLPGAIQNIVVYDTKKSTEDFQRILSYTDSTPGIDKSKVTVLKSRVPLTQSNEFLVKKAGLTVNSRNE
jgi:hypothetical protein